MFEVELVEDAVDLGQERAVELPGERVVLDLAQQERGHVVAARPRGVKFGGEALLRALGVAADLRGDQDAEADERASEVSQHVAQPRGDLRVEEGFVGAAPFGEVRERAGEDPHDHDADLQGVQPGAQHDAGQQRLAGARVEAEAVLRLAEGAVDLGDVLVKAPRLVQPLRRLRHGDGTVELLPQPQ